MVEGGALKTWLTLPSASVRSSVGEGGGWCGLMRGTKSKDRNRIVIDADTSD